MSYRDKMKGEKDGSGVSMRAIPIPPEIGRLLEKGITGSPMEDDRPVPRKGEEVKPGDVRAEDVLAAMEGVGAAIVNARRAVASFTGYAVSEPCPSVAATGKPCKVAGCCAFRGMGGTARDLEKCVESGMKMLDKFDAIMIRNVLQFYALRIKTGVVPGPIELDEMENADKPE